MKVKNEVPPNYDKLKKDFKIEENVMFTYGDTIYNPFNCYIDPMVVKHEEVHSRQQGDKPDEWWDRYLVDVSFRFTQELEAYQHQFRAIKEKFKDRNTQTRMLDILARDLSSTNYGNMCSHNEAYMSIKDNVRFKI